jgi:hypothetical protein
MPIVGHAYVTNTIFNGTRGYTPSAISILDQNLGWISCMVSMVGGNLISQL